MAFKLLRRRLFERSRSFSYGYVHWELLQPHDSCFSGIRPCLSVKIGSVLVRATLFDLTTHTNRIVSAYSSTVASLWKPLFGLSNNYEVIGHHSPSWSSLCLRDRPATRSHFVIDHSQFSPHRRHHLYRMSDQGSDLEDPDIDILLVSPLALCVLTYA